MEMKPAIMEMKPVLAGTALLAAILACGSSASPGGQAVLTPAALSRADSGRPAYTAADVDFMSGMIGHHAQAVLIAGWAPTHGASPAVRALCERIVVGQRDEIAFMQSWLRERHLPVPAGDPSHFMPGMDHGKLMPGMLNAEQLGRLDQARGTEFDRLFLTLMIQHHQGAITMVETLLGSHGAAQDDNVWKFASDVNADQTTEIEFMGKMLDALAPGAKSP
jgi:uncharacterized protein (DUF305 family)